MSTLKDNLVSSWEFDGVNDSITIGSGISNIAAWNRTLSQQELNELYQSGFRIGEFCKFCDCIINENDKNHYREFHSSVDIV